MRSLPLGVGLMGKNTSWIKRAKDGSGRIEEYMSDFAYAPHKHATYALAITTLGVQHFNYRGQLRHALPGEVVILHPDEVHDGQALPGRPFAYRGMTIEPYQVQDILQGASLPFLESGVTKLPEFVLLAKAFLADFEQPFDTLEYQDLLYSFATCLQRATNNSKYHKTTNYQAMKLVKEYLDDELHAQHIAFSAFNLDKLACIANYSKWQVTRDFRALYGTTPYHYVTLKRVHKARTLIEQGVTLTDVAMQCAFADQSHMNRQFKKCFGFTPKMCVKLSL